MLRQFLSPVIVVALLVLAVGTGSVSAQNASTSHVFPQVADGRQADGSYYESLFYIVNMSKSTATCTISMFGLSTSRLAFTGNINIQSGAWSATFTLGQEPLATGYAKVTCSQAVVASLQYFLIAPNDLVRGMATVFSSPGVTYAMLPAIFGGGFRHGIALANDSATAANVTLLFTGSDGQVVGKIIQIPARSQYVRFADEIISLPTQGYGSLELTSGQPFSIVGLLFNGAAFTTLVPATLQ